MSSSGVCLSSATRSWASAARRVARDSRLRCAAGDGGASAPIYKSAGRRFESYAAHPGLSQRYAKLMAGGMPCSRPLPGCRRLARHRMTGQWAGLTGRDFADIARASARLRLTSPIPAPSRSPQQFCPSIRQVSATHSPSRVAIVTLAGAVVYWGVARRLPGRHLALRHSAKSGTKHASGPSSACREQGRPVRLGMSGAEVKRIRGGYRGYC